MRILRSIAVASVTALVLIPAPPAAAASGDAGLGPLAALGRATLAPNDGWAAEGTGTTGGSTADADHVFVVHDPGGAGRRAGRRQRHQPHQRHPEDHLRRRHDRRLRRRRRQPADLRRPTPTRRTRWTPTWPRTTRRCGAGCKPTGPLEDARVRSVTNQTRQTQINVGPNTTIVGLRGAEAHRADPHDRQGVDNVIVRNLHLRRRARLLPGLGPDRRRDRQLELAIRPDRRYAAASTCGSTTTRSTTATTPTAPSRSTSAGRTRCTTARWTSPTRRPGHRVVQQLLRARQDDADRLDQHRRRRRRQAAGHPAPQPVRQRLPAAAPGALRPGRRLQQLLLRSPTRTFELLVGRRRPVGDLRARTTTSAAARLRPGRPRPRLGRHRDDRARHLVRRRQRRPAPVDLLGAYNATHDPDLGADAGWTPTLRAGPVLPAPAVALLVPLLAGAI